MSKGCQEGKGTPRLEEIICPECGEIMEIFVLMGGSVEQTGRLASDEVCPKCGFVAKEGTPAMNFKKA